jgi:hypothetical protein
MLEITHVTEQEARLSIVTVNIRQVIIIYYC